MTDLVDYLRDKLEHADDPQPPTIWERIREVELRRPAAVMVRCCEAGQVAYPEPCPWHVEVVE